MAWVSFSRDFDWRPTRQSVIAYKAGHRLSVTAACAVAAVKAGAASRIKTPRRGEAGRGQ